MPTTAPPQPPPTSPTQTPTVAQPQPPAAGPQPSQMPTAVPTGQTAPAATKPPIADSDRSTAVLLLDRIQRVLDGAVDGKSEQISIDRSLLDELRAEVTQVKMTLQAQKP
jgi:hypothetical protein